MSSARTFFARLFLFLILPVLSASAGVDLSTDRTAFTALISSPVVITFEGIAPAGSSIDYPDGVTLNGVNFAGTSAYGTPGSLDIESASLGGGGLRDWGTGDNLVGDRFGYGQSSGIPVGNILATLPANVYKAGTDYMSVFADGSKPSESVLFNVVSNGTQYDFTVNTNAGGPAFAGFVSDSPITSIRYRTLSVGGDSSSYGALDNFVFAAVGTAQFAAASYNTTENAGSVSIVVSRTGGGAGAISVAYSETDGTAEAGRDYTATSGTLTWIDGDTTDKTITVPILDRSLYDGSTKTFSVVLSGPTGGAALGTPTSASVNILDNDAAPQPTAVIVSPPDGATLTAGGALPVAVSVTDPAGVLSEVRLSANGFPLNTLPATGPFVYDATVPNLPGTYTIQATTVDTLGRTSVSHITVSIIAATTTALPSSGLITPLNGLNLAAGSTLTLDASATAAATTSLDHVSIYADGTLIATFDGQGNLITSAHGGGAVPVRRDASGTVLSNLFTSAYTLAPGVDKLVNLIVTAFDKLGQATVSSVSSVHSVVTTDKAPRVAIGNAGSLAKVRVGSANAVDVTASDPDANASTMGAATGNRMRKDATTDATLAELVYFVNGIKFGSPSTAPPYGFNFSPTAAGKYVLHAVATDATGLSTISDPVVVQAEEVPVVTIAVNGDGTVSAGGKAKLTVSRTGDTSADLTVKYKVKGMVTAGVDYKTLPGSVTIPAGSASAKIKFKALDNALVDGLRVAKIKLRASTDGSYTLGAGVAAKIGIVVHTD